MKRSFLLCTTGLLFFLGGYTTSSAQPAPQDMLPQLGTIQQQDIDDLKRLEQERKGMRDYEKRNLAEEQKAPQKTRSQKTPEEPAAPSEYQTKGVYIEKIDVPESQILTAEEIAAVLKEYERTNLKMEDIKALVEKINDLYLEKGFITARAYLPEQTIEGGKLQIALMEGKVGQVKVEGNRWTRTSHIKSRLDLNEDELFNIQKLEDNVLVYNRYNDGIVLKGDLSAGQKEGTTDIDIKAQEKAPYHVIAVSDNSGRDTIGKYRAGLIAQHDSLLGYRDKLSAGVYANRYSVTPFADYNIPVNKHDGRLGVSFSYNRAKIGHGPYKDFDIESRSQNYSLYYTHPLIHELHKELNVTASYTFKHAVTSFDDFDAYKDKIPALTLGVNYRRDNQSGVWYLAQSVSYAAPWYQGNIDYWKFEGSISRLQDFTHRILGSFRGNYQYIEHDMVPYADQMSAGGFGTVRGYSQGLLTAKSGYQLGAEIYFPLGPEEITLFGKTFRTDEYVRPFIFTDYAALYPYNGTGINDNTLISAGAGMRFQLPYGIVFKAAYGVPLKHNRFQDDKNGDWYLELSYAPDLNWFFSK